MRDSCRLAVHCALSLTAVLLLPKPASAHRLRVECHVLPGNRVQVESWFDNNKQAPEGGDVRVYRLDGSLFAEGQLNAQGVYAFSFHRPERLQVLVFAGGGHSARVWLSEQDLSATSVAPVRDEGNPPPRSVRNTDSSGREVLLGLGFILAVAAFLLSWRNDRRLRALEKRLTSPAEPPRPAAPPIDPGPR